MGVTDPAWFYSSLAQASAAIVGLIGAIFGSRIVEHIAAMRMERRQLDQRINAVYRLFQGRLAHLTRYKEFCEKELRDDIAALSNGMTTRSAERRLNWDGSTTGPWMVDDVVAHKQQMESDLRFLSEVLPAYSAVSFGPITDEVFRTPVRILRGCEVTDPWPEGTVGSDAEDLSVLGGEVLGFRSRLRPHSLIVVLVLLAWLTLTGIVWPLSALPGLPDGYPKGWMLAAVTSGIVGFLLPVGIRAETHRSAVVDVGTPWRVSCDFTRVSGTKCSRDWGINNSPEGSGLPAAAVACKASGSIYRSWPVNDRI